MRTTKEPALRWQEDAKELQKQRKAVPGLTQARLAKLAGFKPSYVAAVEAGNVPLRFPKAEALWQAIFSAERAYKIPEIKKTLAKTIESEDWQAAMHHLLFMAQEPDEAFSRAATELLMERYAELDCDERRWVGEQLNLLIWAEIPNAKVSSNTSASGLGGYPPTQAQAPESEQAPTDIDGVKNRLIKLRELISRRETKITPRTSAASEAERLREELERERNYSAILQRLITAQDKLIEALKGDAADKEAKLIELQGKVNDLRELYEVGIEAALAHEKFENLRTKLSEEDNDD